MLFTTCLKDILANVCLSATHLSTDRAISHNLSLLLLSPLITFSSWKLYLYCVSYILSSSTFHILVIFPETSEPSEAKLCRKDVCVDLYRFVYLRLYPEKTWPTWTNLDPRLDKTLIIFSKTISLNDWLVGSYK